jgi:hypothetical protein
MRNTLMRPETLALDLEGTLVSNAVSQIARPGLYEFLEFCRRAVPRLVIYTAVGEGRVRDVAAGLVAEGSAPGWFPSIEYVRWSGAKKDLALIPGAAMARTLLIDDDEGCVVPEQRHRWLQIESFSPPYAADGNELRRIRRILEDEWGCRAA